MRLIDADAFKAYIRNAYEQVKHMYPDGGKWARQITEDFCKDIDEQPTIDTSNTSNTLGALDCVERQFEEIVVEYPNITDEEHKGKPYYSIKYIENGEDKIIGFGTYKIEVLSRYIRDYFIQSVQPEFSNNSKLEKNSKELENKNGELTSRQDAIDALKICDSNEDGINCHKCPLRDERWDGAWQDNETNCYRKLMRDSAKLLELPSVQPRRGKWAGKGDSEGFGIFICDNCGKFAMMEYDFCPNCGADMRGGDA